WFGVRRFIAAFVLFSLRRKSRRNKTKAPLKRTHSKRRKTKAAINRRTPKSATEWRDTFKNKTARNIPAVPFSPCQSHYTQGRPASLFRRLFHALRLVSLLPPHSRAGRRGRTGPAQRRAPHRRRPRPRPRLLRQQQDQDAPPRRAGEERHALHARLR